MQITDTRMSIINADAFNAKIMKLATRLYFGAVEKYVTS